MDKIKITYIISNIDKALEFEWVANHLSKDKFELSFILLNSKKSHLYEFLKSNGFYVKEYMFKSKLHYPQLIINCIKEFKKIKPNIVHCHLIDASLVGFAAAKACGIKNRIHTRHHSTFHHVYAPNGIKYDRWINKNSKKIIAVSNVVKEVLTHKESISENKIKVIPHALDFSIFKNSKETEIKELKLKHNIIGSPIIGVISRYEKWKGVGYIIDAFKDFIEIYPNATLVLANAGKGDDVENIKSKLKNIPSTNYIEIVFEKNINTLYETFDIFVHCPIDNHSEAFGQIYIEAMYKRIPMIATKSGIGNELLNHQFNSIVVDYKNSKEILNGMVSLLKDDKLKNEIISNGFKEIETNYHIKNKIQALENLYLEII